MLTILFSEAALAGSYVAKCSGFTGQYIDHVSGHAEDFKLDDGTIYEFRYSDEGVVSLKYVVSGVGIIEPKKEDRWHDLEIIGEPSNYVSASDSGAQ